MVGKLKERNYNSLNVRRRADGGTERGAAEGEAERGAEREAL